MRTSFCVAIPFALLAACGPKPEPEPPTVAPPPPAPTVEAPPPPAAPSAEELAKKEADEAARKKLADLEVKAKAERERWTDELRESVKKLSGKKYWNATTGLQAALKSPHRQAGHAERDAARHPIKTMNFMGLRPDMTVLEIGSGAGWYTELLAPVLATRGKLLVTARDPNGPETESATFYGRRFKHYIDKSEELSGKVEVIIVDPKNMQLGHAGKVDLAFAFREMHNWHRRGRRVKPNLEQVFAALKPGGTFGVVQHRAAEGANPDESAEKGYLPEAWVVEQVEAVGFKLAKKSEINANSKDIKDYPEGVWTLPPTLRLKDKDRDKYVAIGESDRMTLKFTKPKAAAK